MGFFDSFKGFVGGVGDFLGDVAGAVGGFAQTDVGQQIVGGLIQRALGAPPTFQPGGFPVAAPFSRGGVPVRQAPPLQLPAPSFPSGTQISTTPVQSFQRVFDLDRGTIPFEGSAEGFRRVAEFPVQRRGFNGGAVAERGFFDIPFVDFQSPVVLESTVRARAAAAACPPMFAAGRQSVRARNFSTPHPVTGEPVFFKPAGRPILFAGDLTACKRVAKVARLAARKSLRRPR